MTDRTMTIQKERERKLAFVEKQDPEGAEKLKKLLSREETLRTTGNVYGERFTERQFTLYFDPLLHDAHERAQILEALSANPMTVPSMAAFLGMDAQIIFQHMRELLRRELVIIAGYKDRYAVFARNIEERHG